MTIAAARVPPLSAPETTWCQSGRAGFSASAVMTVVALTGTLPGLKV
jgi:hypothetical protein